MIIYADFGRNLQGKKITAAYCNYRRRKKKSQEESEK
jgi:hypothetical protein